METYIKDMLPEEDKLVKLWCINKKNGRRAYGEYKIMSRDGITLNWCGRDGRLAHELIDTWTPETWEKL